MKITIYGTDSKLFYRMVNDFCCSEQSFCRATIVISTPYQAFEMEERDIFCLQFPYKKTKNGYKISLRHSGTENLQNVKLSNMKELSETRYFILR